MKQLFGFLILAMSMWFVSLEASAGESSGGNDAAGFTESSTALPGLSDLKDGLGALDIQPAAESKEPSPAGVDDSKMRASNDGGVISVIVGLLGRTEVQTIVIAALALLFGILKRLSFVKSWRLTRGLECLEAGVRVTYEEYVRAIKDASTDGKLTDNERREARGRAIERAKEYAANEGIELGKVYAKEFLPVLVERIVNRNKVDSKLPFAFSATL